LSFEITFYSKNDGDSPIIDFLESLSDKELNKSLQYMLLLAERGNTLTANFIKHIEADLWELRPEFGGVEMRYFYFTWVDDVIVIVHSLKKKRRKLPRREIDLALRRISEVKDGKSSIVQIVLG